MSQHFWNTVTVCWKGSWKLVRSERWWSKLPLSTRTARVLYLYCRNCKYGAEYQTGGPDNGPLQSVYQHNVPCAVCYTSTRETVVMIPAQLTCPSSWTREYYGYLMANSFIYYRTMYECVDQAPQSVPGSTADTNGALFYHTEVKCNGIPCPPYDTQKEVTCVVCTK